MWAWLSTHDGIAGALLGAVVGGILGFVATYASQYMQRGEARQVARMRVATDLRYWLRYTIRAVGEPGTFVESDGAGGTATSKLADFRFEADLEQVTKLDKATATSVFELIHSKDDVNAAVDGTFEYVGDEEGLDVFRGQAAKLFLEGVGIYKNICAEIDWKSDAFSESDVTFMRGEVKRLQEIEAQQAASATDWFTPPSDKVLTTRDAAKH